MENKTNPLFHSLWDQAMAKGREAAKAMTPAPMGVVRADVLGRPLPGATVEVVHEGPCGFAWLRFSGNTAFGRWAKRELGARKGYPSGLSVSIHDYNQSMQRKEAHARAAAAFLRENGIDVWADSRMD